MQHCFSVKKKSAKTLRYSQKNNIFFLSIERLRESAAAFAAKNTPGRPPSPFPFFHCERGGGWGGVNRIESTKSGYENGTSRKKPSQNSRFPPPPMKQNGAAKWRVKKSFRVKISRIFMFPSGPSSSSSSTVVNTPFCTCLPRVKWNLCVGTRLKCCDSSFLLQKCGKARNGQILAKVIPPSETYFKTHFRNQSTALVPSYNHKH